MKHIYTRLVSHGRAIILCVWFALSFDGYAAHIPVSIARQVGEAFFATPGIGRDAVDLTLIHTSISGSSSEPVTCFYVFNEAGGGFVIVAGDDAVVPVLAYSTAGAFDPDDMPINVAKWLEGYKNEILAEVAIGNDTSVEVPAAWQAILNGDGLGSADRSDRAVNPLLQTNWNQNPYYNAQCPGGSVSGCVATAMAQIMKFWNYPATGSGFHQYNHPQYGTLAANFGGTTYQWGSMPNNVSGPNSSVATLMYHCGVSVDMQYSPTGSYAYVIDGGPSQYTAENALEEFFGYQASLQGVLRVSYNDQQWIDLLRGELDAGQPILYAGSGTGGGHAFVCDGYDDNNFFHFNWGWGGNSDGYFTTSALNPGSIGTGGGAGGFNSQQHAVIGIRPPASSITHNMALYDYVTPSSSTLGYGQAFTVSTNIVNNGTSTFDGDYCAAAFDDANNFVGFVQVLTGYNLQSGYVYTGGLTFSTTGMFGMVPGTYRIGIFYRPTGGNWVQVSNNGAYTNLPQVTVVNYNNIALNSAISTSPSGSLVQGSPLSVNLNIVNNGPGTFIGQYGVALYNLDGSWAQDIGTLNESAGLPSGYTYLAPFLTFGSVPITVQPGTYLLAVQHNPSGSGWQLTGTGAFNNPITVTVISAPLSPDIYEVNNTSAQAYTLPVSFSGNTATPNTVGANLHITSDLDHYKVVLPDGYSYAITARLHDSYNSGNGVLYTADALFSWSTDGTNWSSTFDDIMPGDIPLGNGGTVYFRVAPYFVGEVGTYLLQLNISQTALVGIEERSGLDALRLFPNPANTIMTIVAEQVAGMMRVRINDGQGKLVKEVTDLSLRSGRVTVDVSDLIVGFYHVQLITAAGSRTESLLIAR